MRTAISELPPYISTIIPQKIFLLIIRMQIFLGCHILGESEVSIIIVQYLIYPCSFHWQTGWVQTERSTRYAEMIILVSIYLFCLCLSLELCLVVFSIVSLYQSLACIVSLYLSISLSFKMSLSLLMLRYQSISLLHKDLFFFLV